MSLSRIKAILLQEFYITRSSLAVIMDLFFYSAVSVIVFGFIFIYISISANPKAAEVLLVGLLLWEVIRINQYSVSVGALWNIWSRNLSNMFIAPLTIGEYVIAHVMAAFFKSLLVFLVISSIALWIFDFNIFRFGFINIFWYLFNLSIFAWSTGLVLLGLIFRYGHRIQALAWGLVFLFQPLTAAYFPLQVLPKWLQQIALLFPPTYIFEAARASLTNPAVDWSRIGIALTENILYFIIGLWWFIYLFKKSKESGQFAKNEQ